MSNCCNCCLIPNSGYKLYPHKCGVCALMGKSKCYFDRTRKSEENENTPLRYLPKTLESTQLSTKRPYQSPQFSQEQEDNLGSGSKLGSYGDESVYVNPFQISKNQIVVMPVYYDVEIPIYPREIFVTEQQDLTTFRPSKMNRENVRLSRKSPLRPIELIRALNIRK